MWTLPRPHTNDLKEDITKALTYASGVPIYSITDTQIDAIILLYDLYDNLCGKPDARLTANEFQEDLLEAMHNAYGETYEGRRLARLRERIKLAALKCPYCGFGEIKDLDHHIPKSSYKALSIYPLNLVPTCHPCNNKKRTIAGDLPNAQFFHTYLDSLSSVKFLYANIDLSNKKFVAKFELKKPVEIDMDTFERLHFQFTRLELNARLQPEVLNFISSHRTAIETIAEVGPDHLKKFLEKASDNSVRDFGKNHWQTALWSALAQHDDFCSGGYSLAFGDISAYAGA